MASAKEVSDEDIYRWRNEWAEIEAIIEKTYPDIPELQVDKVRIDELLNTGQYALHHSAQYNAAYHPHYRIIAKEFMNMAMPITVNLRYTGTNGKARKFAEEMISSGTVDAIRAEKGNLRYEYVERAQAAGKPLDGKVIVAIVYKHPEIFCFNEGRVRLLM